MGILDIFNKPLSLDPALFGQPKVPTPVVPTPLKPVATPSLLPPAPKSLSIISNPLPSSVIAALKAPPITTIPNPIPKVSPVTNILQKIAAPVSPNVVRTQDWGDVINLIPQLIGGAVQPAAEIGTSLLELSNKKLGTNFPTTFNIPNIANKQKGYLTVDAPPPDWFKQHIEQQNNQTVHPAVLQQEWENYAEKNNKEISTAASADSLQTTFHTHIAAGDSPTKAFLKTALQGGMDISFALPLSRILTESTQGFSKLLAMKGSPEKLISPEVVTASRENVRDFLTGRTTSDTSPLPPELQKIILEAPDKKKILSGFDLASAKPSRLGKLLGVSQEEADKILTELYGGKERPATAGAIPGYVPETPRVAHAGMSVERVKPVGFKTPDLTEYSPASQKTAEAFDRSVDHTPIPNKLGVDIEIGTFGKNALERKVVNTDRFPVTEIPAALDKTFLAVPASADPKNYRSGNIVLLSKEGDGMRAVYARPNKSGALEVINAHSIPSEKLETYFKDIGQDSISNQIRTGNANLEDSGFVRLAYGDSLSVQDQLTQANAKVKSVDSVGQEQPKVNEQGVDSVNSQVPALAAKKPLFTSIKGKKITIEKAKELIYRDIPKEKVNLIFDENLMKNEGNLGEYRSPRPGMKGVLKPVISLYTEGNMTSAHTAFHESGHYIVDNFLSAQEKRDLLDLAKKEMGPLSKADYKIMKGYKGEDNILEEFAMDKYADYRSNEEGYKTSAWRKLFLKIDAIIRDILQTFRDVAQNIKQTYAETGQAGHIRNPLVPKEPIKPTEPDIRTADLNGNPEESMYKNALELDDLKRVLEDHPAKGLIKYISRETGELPEITGTKTMKSLTGSGKEVKRSMFGREGDTILQHVFGFPNLQSAQASVDQYMDLRKRYDATAETYKKEKAAYDKEQVELEKVYKQELASNPTFKAEVEALRREQRSAAREARDLQLQKEGTAGTPSTGEVPGSGPDIGPNESYDESIPQTVADIKPPIVRGNLSAPQLDFSIWKDKPALSLARETMERNIERVAGKDAEKVKDFYIKPIRKNETARIDFINKLRQETRGTIVKEYGIRAGSEASKLVQEYGEKAFDLEHLKGLRPNDWHRIEKAATYFRDKYDMLLDMVNAERARYDYAPIPKHDDYFRHFQEITGAIQQVGLILREQDLPTQIAGLTGLFNPGKPFSSAELRRRGELGSTVDAVKGFDNYIDSISRQIFHIDSVQRGRALEKYIREAAKVSDEIASVPSEVIKLPNFVSNLHDHTNLVSGKKSALDRALESLIGRPLYGATQWIRRRVSANMVGGNLGSAITNFIPFTQSLSTTNKLDAIHGLGTSLMSPFQADEFPFINGVKSSFLTRRFQENGIDIRGFKKVSEMANWAFEAVDRFTSKAILSAKYYENLSKGMLPLDAMENADEYAGRVLQDRSIGNLPNVFEAKSLGFLTQFQVEVNNMFSFLTRDIPKFSENKKASMLNKIAQFVLFSYLFNQAYEKITGRRPTIDPIYTTLTLLGMTDETDQSTLGRRATLALEDLGGNLPFTGAFTGGRFPISAAMPDIAGLTKGDTTLGKELLKPAEFLAPPFGGLQAVKTFQGLRAFLAGKDTTAKGNTRYEIPQTPGKALQAGIFGKSSLSEARQYYSGFNNRGAEKKVTPNSKSKLQGIKLTPKAGGPKLELKTGGLKGSGIKLVPKKAKTNSRTEETDYLEPINIKPPKAGIDFNEKDTGKVGGFINQVVDTVANNTPFFESSEGKKLKKGAYQAYPFTNSIKSSLNDHAEVSMVGDLGPRKGGQELPFRLVDYIPGGTAAANKLDDLGLMPEPLARMLLAKRGNRETVQVGSNAVQVIAHELFHAAAQETNFDSDAFNEAWSTVGKNKITEAIDNHIGGARDLYDTSDTDSLANERFAYLGETRGVGGLKAIPSQLRPFYEKILN